MAGGLRLDRVPGAAGMRKWLIRPLTHRFRDAFRGIWLAYQEEPNLRFHLFAATVILFLAVGAGVSRFEGLYLLGTVALVLVTEALNTAVERAVDFTAAGREHSLARQAKDSAAGAVLLAVGHAVLAGTWVFLWPAGPIALVTRLWAFTQTQPALAAVLGLVAAAAGVLGLMAGNDRRGSADD